MIPSFTGISAPYEVPENAEISIDTTGQSIDESAEQILSYLRENGFLD